MKIVKVVAYRKNKVQVLKSFIVDDERDFSFQIARWTQANDIVSWHREA